MFQVNDTVRYSTAGVCKITEIITRPFNGEDKEYYVLHPVHDEHSTLYVPVDNEQLAGKMYTVLSKDEVEALIASMPGLEPLWIEEEQQRRKTYREILTSRDRQGAVRVIKGLYAHAGQLKEKGKKLRMEDERCLRDAQRLLYDEFAQVLEMMPADVLPFIVKTLDT